MNENSLSEVKFSKVINAMNELMAVTNEVVSPDMNPALVYLASLNSVSSHKTMFGVLTSVARLVTNNEDASINDVDWTLLRYQHVTLIKSKLSDKAPATINKYLAALRRVSREAYRLGYTSHDEYQRIADVSDVIGNRVVTGRDVSYDEIKSIVDTAKTMNTNKAIRDCAILALLYGTGMRRNELASLELSNYDKGTGKLRFIGKRNSERELFIAGKVMEYLDAWLVIRGNHDGAIFSSINKGGNIGHNGITAQAIYNLIKEYASTAGIADLSPHDLRRTFIGNMLDSGVDIATVSEIVGHDNPLTTKKYDRRGARAKVKAAHTVNMP